MFFAVDLCAIARLNERAARRLQRQIDELDEAGGGLESARPDLRLYTCREQKLEHRPHSLAQLASSCVPPCTSQNAASSPARQPLAFSRRFSSSTSCRVLAAFLVAHVEPQARPLPDLRRVLIQVAEDALVVPPDARRKHGQLAETICMAQAEIKRHQPAERRAAQAGEFALGAHAILRGDPGQQSRA